jgi:predicted ATPase/GAF domain-containing protein
LERQSKFQFDEIIDETATCSVHRGTLDGRKAIFKHLKLSFSDAKGSDRFRYEYELTKSLDSDFVIKALGHFDYEGRPLIVFEDFGGQSLSRLVQKKTYSLEDICSIGHQIAAGLTAVHQQDIIHKDLSANNILMSADGKVKISDFGIATKVQGERSYFHNGAMEGTVHYMSPEQTGRMNTRIDYRTDFFSFGAILYQLITGRVPFKGVDDIESIYLILASEPKDPRSFRSETPEMLVRIVNKLLSKNPSDRYESSIGIEADLENCLKQLRTNGKIDVFQLAQSDVPQNFTVGERLYGREKEIAQLLWSFDNAVKGQANLLQVAGPSGIGKSALVEQIRKPLLAHHGLLLQGKYDQFKRNMPYYALASALNDFVAGLLREDDSTVAPTVDRISKALGGSAQLLADLVPLLPKLLKIKPAAENEDSDKADFRIRRTILSFINAVARPECPLVLFLDDIQWADTSSLDVIEALMKPGACSHFLMLVAYRDNEVSPSHPAILCMNSIAQAGVETNYLQVSPLTLTATVELLSDSLRVPKSKVEGLAKIVAAKTAGNAFFVKTFLMHLYSKGLIRFDVAAKSWAWAEQEIASLTVTDNVIEILLEKMGVLDKDAQKAISVAACVGRKFDLNTMTLLLRKSLLECAIILWKAKELGFIEALSADMHLLVRSSDANAVDYDGKKMWFRFAHDRVQQAAYELMQPEERNSLRAQIGSVLLDSLSQVEAQERLHEIVDHLNYTDMAGASDSTRQKLVELNVRAGKLAQISGAFDVALKYFSKAQSYLSADAWNKDYVLRSEIMFGLARSFLALNMYDEGCSTVLADISKLKAPLEIANAYELLGAYYESSSQYDKCIQACLAGLKVLKIKMREKNNDLRLVQEVALFKALCFKKCVNMPESGWPRPNERWRMIQKLVTRMATSSFFLNQNLFVLQYIRLFVAAAKEKVYIDNPACTGVLGMVMVIIRDAKGALAFQKIARNQLAEKRYEESSPIFYCADSHWMGPIQESYKQCLEIGKQGYAKAMEFGDLPFAGVTAFLTSLTAMGGGLRLPEIAKLNEVFRHFFSKVSPDNYMAAGFFSIAQVARAFAGLTSSPTSMTDSEVNEDDVALRCKRSPGDASMYRVMKSWLYFHAGEYKQVVRTGLFNMIQRTLPGCFTAAINATIVSVSMLRQIRSNTFGLPSFVGRFAANVYMLELLWWSGKGSISSGLFNFVRGEYFWTFGNYKAAIVQFEKALAHFIKSDQFYWAAASHESLARLYSHLKAPLPSAAHLSEALQHFARFGAAPKVALLKSELSAERVPLSRTEVGSVNRERSYQGTTSQTKTGVDNLDLESILKVSQAISGQMNQEQLVVDILRIAMENAGATHGSMVLAEENELRLRVTGAQDHDGFHGNLSNLIVNDEIKTQLALRVLRYTVRTGEELVINSSRSEYSDDHYLKLVQAKSVLSLPIVSEGTVVGVLMLENRLVENAFTTERLKSLRVISTQGAISLKNAGFVHDIGILKSHLEKILVGTRDMAASQSLDTAIKIAIKTIGQEVPRFAGSVAKVVMATDQLRTRFVERTLRVDGDSDSLTVLETAEKRLGELYSVKELTPVSSTELAVPIMWQGETVSLLLFEQLADVNLSKEDIRFVETLCQSLALSLRNIEHQVRLEQLVEERTNELNDALQVVTSKQKKIQAIMDNIDQGILTIVTELEIEEEFSARLPSILGVDGSKVAGANAANLIFNTALLSPEEINRIVETLNIVIGDDEFSWELNSGHLPSEIVRKGDSGERIVGMEWKPMYDSTGTIHKLMLVLRDLTDQREFEKKAKTAQADHERKLAAVGLMLKMDRGRLQNYLNDASARIIRVRSAASDSNGLKEIFREVHTIKGLSSSMGFSDVANHAHSAEDCLPSFNKEQKVFRSKDFFECIKLMEEAVGHYNSVFREVFSNAESTEIGLQNLIVPLRSRLTKIVQNSSVKFKSFEVHDEIAVWSESLCQVLSAILPHCVNNAIDHGYLIPSTRGKVVRPVEISVFAAPIDDTRLEVLIQDRGVGLDHNKLKGLAAESGLTPDRYLEVLFLDGKSTAESVTETSGRGIGLGAARKIARDNGGDVVLSDREGGGTMCKITLSAVSEIKKPVQFDKAS